MDENELKEIEDTANAVTPNPGHLITVLAHKDVPALIAEVRRLREMLGGAELHIYCPGCKLLCVSVFVGGKLVQK